MKERKINRPKTLVDAFCPKEPETDMEVDIHVGLGQHIFYRTDTLLVTYDSHRLRLSVRNGGLVVGSDEPFTVEAK
jgi:hypothetical protein